MVANEIYSAKYYDSKLEKEVDFEYVKTLTPQQKITFLNNVLTVLFQDDYCYSIIRDEVIDFMIVDSFTNILKADEDFDYSLNAINEFLNNTNVTDVLLFGEEHINYKLVESLIDAVDLNIAYKTGVNKNDLSTAFSSLLKTIEKKVNSFDVNELSDTLKEFGKITDGFSAEKIMDLYTKTDAFKKNYEETLQNKNEEIRSLKYLYETKINN